MTPVIRRITAAPADVERYRACRLEMLADEPIAFTRTYESASKQPQSFWIERVTRGAESDTQLLLVAEKEQVFVGSFTAIINDDGDCWIYGVWVHKRHRGTGLTKRLLEQVIAWAKAAGAKRLMLHVNSTNDRARRFYEREGFQLTGGKYPHENFPTTDELEMSRPLER